MWAAPTVLQVAVFLPQLVQLLRGDSDRSIADFLIQGARKSSYFAHILLSILTVCPSEWPRHQIAHPSNFMTGNFELTRIPIAPSWPSGSLSPGGYAILPRAHRPLSGPYKHTCLHSPPRPHPDFNVFVDNCPADAAMFEPILTCFERCQHFWPLLSHNLNAG